MTNEQLLEMVKTLSWEAMEAYDEDEPDVATREYNKGRWYALHDLALSLNLEVTGQDVRINKE
jgi:hypothetical protein